MEDYWRRLEHGLITGVAGVSPLVTPKLEFQRGSGSWGQILGEVLACSAIRLHKSCHFFGNLCQSKGFPLWGTWH